MHYKFIWYCFLVIFANTLLQYFLTIDFTSRIKKKNSTSTGSSDFVAAPESGQALPLSPSSVSRVQVAPCLFVVVCMFCYLILLVCMWMHVALLMQLSSDRLVCTTDSCRIAALQPLQSQRSVSAWFISCCLHVSSIDLACMHVNACCSAMWLSSDWLVCTTDSCHIAAPPP